MPCVSCGYNLRQLSVLDVCPECGTPVRATVLAVVDPYASVLQPVRWKRLVAGGLIVWAGGAFAAALISWMLRVVDLYAVISGSEVRFPLWGRAGAALGAMSVVGAIVLIRPHAKIPLWQCVCAAGGVLCGAGVVAMYWKMHVEHDPYHLRPFIETVVAQPTRAWMRILTGGLLAGAMLLLRPSARMLAARSLVLRMGHADRQTMRAMAAALGVAAIGDLVRLAGIYAGAPLQAVLNTLGIVLIAVGSILVTVGLGGLLVDCVRIARVILRPPAALRDVVGDPA